MKKMIEFELIQDIFMNTVMTIATMLLTSGLTDIATFFNNFYKAYLINIVSGIFLNYIGFFPCINNYLNKHNKAKLFNAFIGLFNATLITLSMTLINVGFNDNFLQAWLATYPILVVVAIVSAYIFAPITSKLIK